MSAVPRGGLRRHRTCGRAGCRIVATSTHLPLAGVLDVGNSVIFQLVAGQHRRQLHVGGKCVEVGGGLIITLLAIICPAASCDARRRHRQGRGHEQLQRAGCDAS